LNHRVGVGWPRDHKRVVLHPRRRRSLSDSGRNRPFVSHLAPARPERLAQHSNHYSARAADNTCAAELAGRNQYAFQRGLAAATYPAVTSSLWAAKVARTSAFSRFGTLAKSRLRPSSAATSSNSAGEMRRARWASSRPSGVLPGLVAVNWKGPPETLQTQSVRMNLRPGNLPRFLVCHSRSCGFLDFWPTMGFFTTASLKWSTTAAMAKTPPSRS